MSVQSSLQSWLAGGARPQGSECTTAGLQPATHIIVLAPLLHASASDAAARPYIAVAFADGSHEPLAWRPLSSADKLELETWARAKAIAVKPVTPALNCPPPPRPFVGPPPLAASTDQAKEDDMRAHIESSAAEWFKPVSRNAITRPAATPA